MKALDEYISGYSRFDLLQSRQLLSTSTSRTCLTAGQDGDAIMIKEG